MNSSTASQAAPSQSPSPLIALAGVPNCGKTALFNALTGSRQKVANYAGVTVERKEGVTRSPAGRNIRVLDLPGSYSLVPRTPDEEITRDALSGRLGDENAPELLIAVADATNLERNLGFVLELRALRKPVVLALNMYDLATERGLKLDLDILSRELGVPVVPTVAVKKEGVKALLDRVDDLLFSSGRKATVTGVNTLPDGPASTDPRVRFLEVDRVLKLATRAPTAPAFGSHKIDRWVLHPVLGVVLLFFVLALMFQAIFTWAAPMQDAIEALFGAAGAWVSAMMPEGALRDLMVDGVIAGVGSVLVFLPQILLLFFFILFLEDSGYMARAAFLMDRIMGAVGLHGRAFIPLLSSFACAIPGIMATRTIENRRDRLATILIAPLMTCSARLPVYSLLIAAFIPNTPVFGPFRLQGLVMLGLYVAGVVSAIAVAFVLKKLVFRGNTPPLLLELPTYKWPNFRSLMVGLWERARIFIRRAGTVILSLTILLWFLASYPKAPAPGTASSPEPDIYYSYAGQIGRAIEPVLRPLGFDWRISIAMIPGFAAREVMVSALATVYAVEAAAVPEGGDEEAAMQESLGARLSAQWGLATALSLLVWYIFAPQCLATLAVIKRETYGWRWPLVSLVYLVGLAYGASWVTYRVTLLWVG